MLYSLGAFVHFVALPMTELHT